MFRFGEISGVHSRVESWSFRATPPRDRPNLNFPAELLSQIFEEAAFIPGLMDTEIFDPFESGSSMPSTLRLSRTALKLTLHITYTMMLTCKSWYNVALPLLYRFIFIENHKQVLTLRATLQASQEQAQALSNGAASLSSRVRHLVLSFHPSDPFVVGSIAFWSALAEIIRFLPNLEILSGINRLSSAMVRHPMRECHQDYICPDLMDSCKKLRRISFDGDASMIIDPHTRDIFLRGFPHLQTITGGGCLLDCTAGMPAHANITMLTIDSSASSCGTPHNPARPSFPSVTQVILRLIIEETRTESWLHFLQAHGTQLHTVHIDLREARFPRGGARLVRLLLVRYCPQLTTVHLALNHAADLDNVPTLPRTLARLSLYVGLLYEEDGVADLLGTTAGLAPSALEVLRFTNAELTRSLRQHIRSSSARASSPFAGRRTRLEDHRGRDLLQAA